MESLTETETETDDNNDHERSNLVSTPPVVPEPAASKSSKINDQEDGVSPVGCVPFFGVKHYLHNFYGLPDDAGSSKVWQQTIMEGDGMDDCNMASRGRRSGQQCWGRLRRVCFSYSIIVGMLVILLGVTCLLLGYLLPRQPILISQIEENDLKMWIATHRQAQASGTPSASLAILDRKAIEYNNLLDLLKITGLVAICCGALVLVAALLVPACRPSRRHHWADEPEGGDDEHQRISHLNQTLKNCLRSIHLKTHSTVFYSGVVASTDEKIPVFQQLQSVQPAH